MCVCVCFVSFVRRQRFCFVHKNKKTSEINRLYDESAILIFIRLFLSWFQLEHFINVNLIECKWKWDINACREQMIWVSFVSMELREIATKSRYSKRKRSNRVCHCFALNVKRWLSHYVSHSMYALLATRIPLWFNAIATRAMQSVYR